VSKTCSRPLAALVAIVSLGIPAKAQNSEISSVKGEVHSASATDFREFWVELIDMSHSGASYRAAVEPGGGFEFRYVSTGQYRLRVTNLQGDSICEQFVGVNSQSGLLTIDLPSTARQPSAPGTISLRQLSHPPTPQAYKAAVSAQRFIQAGQPEKAEAELQKAIRLSPDFADAYNILAVEHLRMKRYEEAATEVSRAIEIAGPSPMTLCNLAYADYQLHRNADAITATRSALRLDSAYPQAHLILGSILAADPRTRAESIPHLERAAETLPSARATLEKVRSLQY
jgi:tetratricopeptide (TPR) repeat protein